MEEALIKRVLPHSVEAEQSVIGAMLMDQEAIIKASEIISGDDFYQHQYGIVFDAIVELYNDGKPVDLSRCRIFCVKKTYRLRSAVWSLSKIC